MNESELTSLIDAVLRNRTETSNVELKDARGGMPQDIWRSISSFSHSPEGGVIFFGIKEDREKGTVKIVGNLDLALLQEQIVSFYREKMVNAELPDLKVMEYEGKYILALTVRHIPDEKKPCYRKDLGLPNGACIRIGNTDRVISFEEMKQFIRNSALYKYDSSVAKDTYLTMLSVPKIREFLAKSSIKIKRKGNDIPSNEVMVNMGVAVEEKRNVFPTVAGFLIFAESEPQSVGLYSRYVIRCVKYAGITPASPIVDKLDIRGTLDHQIDEMQRFILKNIGVKVRIVGTRRVEEYEYPEDAIREIVANAVIHRDYMITETYTQVNIFSNRIEIINPGTLPPGITIENIKQSQFSRNEIIASILKDMDYLEEYGRGIDIVFSRMKEIGLQEPIFKNTSNSFKVTLPGDQFSELNQRQIEIWHTLQDRNRMTAKECQQLFENISRASISIDLSKLVELGLIVSKGSGSSTYYETE